MEIKKCSNCGSFITTDSLLCTKCANKKLLESTVLKNYFEENSSFDSISEISENTGISINGVKDYMQNNNYLG